MLDPRKKQRKPADPRIVAHNIISVHGKAAFQKLIELFQEGASGSKIGVAYGVSRQRVSQWKATLGQERVSYEVHRDIKDLVAPKQDRTTKRTLV